MSLSQAWEFFFGNLSKLVMGCLVCCFLFTLFLFPSLAFGQFAPPAGQVGSDAVHADSNIIINWATNAIIERGFQQIDDVNSGYASYGNESDAIGKADGFVVSLGDGGSALLQFDFPIFNGSGADFVVFENAFDEQFLELAHVAVSSDGENFFSFPAHSLTDTSEQVGSFGTLDASKIHHLAGKYRAPYGVPFDLDSLPESPLLDKSLVTHISITDVVGILDNEWGSRDSKGRLINDPWPTPFPSSGFDLDAIGVIHDASNLSLSSSSLSDFYIWPNPFYNGFNMTCNTAGVMQVYNQQGILMMQTGISSGKNYIDATKWHSATYIVNVVVNRQVYHLKAIKQ